MTTSTDKLKKLIHSLEEIISEIEQIKKINADMHSQVSGYLKGADWQHWNEHNKSRFEIKQEIPLLNYYKNKATEYQIKYDTALEISDDEMANFYMSEHLNYLELIKQVTKKE